MAGEVLNMNILDINKHRCKLKDLCSKNRHKSYTHRYGSIKNQAFNTNKSPF